MFEDNDEINLETPGPRPCVRPDPIFRQVPNSAMD
jgi:hypothetical protein